MMRGALCAMASLVLLAGCQAGGDSANGPSEAFDGIKAEETVRFTGTEPFWGGEAGGGVARYSTPDDPDGTRFTVSRFAGLNGVSFSGEVYGQAFDLMVTPGTCSDGMSDRTYPYTATLMIGNGTREGCAWTDAQPYTGAEQP